MEHSMTKNHFENIRAKYGEDSIECIEANEKKCPIAYPRFRFLNPDSYPELCELICLDILQGRATELSLLELTIEEIDIVKPYILRNHVDFQCPKRFITKHF